MMCRGEIVSVLLYVVTTAIVYDLVPGFKVSARGCGFKSSDVVWLVEYAV